MNLLKKKCEFGKKKCEPWKQNTILGLDSDLELDSLETDLILDDDGDIDDEDDCLEEDSIQAIPAPVWPNR